MKGLLIIISISIFSFNSGCNERQRDNESIEMLTRFYSEYIVLWDNMSDFTPEDFEAKVLEMQRLYCSKPMLLKLQEFYERFRLEHDLLTNDWGGTSEELLQSSLSISRDEKRNDIYVVSYDIEVEYPSVSRKDKNVIYVKVVQEEEKYKIDEILD